MNKNKPPKRKGKIILINTSQEYKKGRPKNYIPDESIKKIAQAFIKGEDVEKFAKVITKQTAIENDCNLSPSRYIDTSQKESYRPIPEILEELKTLEEKSKEVDEELKKTFSQIKL